MYCNPIRNQNSQGCANTNLSLVEHYLRGYSENCSHIGIVL